MSPFRVAWVGRLMEIKENQISTPRIPLGVASVRLACSKSASVDVYGPKGGGVLPACGHQVLEEKDEPEFAWRRRGGW